MLALLSCLCPCSLWTLRMSCSQALCLVLVWGITSIQEKDLPLFVLKEVSASNLCHTERTMPPTKLLWINRNKW